MKKTDCYFYSEFYDMGAHISCCTFKEYPLGKCPCDECTNYLPKKEVSKIVREYLEHKAMPPAEPKTCKDCKWWRDSDGAYRRGVKAESRCPINTVTVANGWGYCYMFEPQERSE